MALRLHSRLSAFIRGRNQISIQQPVKQMLLPGELHPWDKVNIYSKVQGFVKEMYADRGTTVKKGQLLAVLDAPEISAELDQAYA